ncbi:MAG: phosphate/phosphite/phosphonate ABC transporter substrate-binding protein [Spirochaetes bacterium]|nr:phosphate/phosphite/phosphonate ABC transporter substrate-binding protein [Spirochaetota bacterium]
MKKIIFIVIMVIFGCSSKRKGTEQNPISIYFMPSSGSSAVINDSIKLADYLRKKTGYYFMPVIPVSYSDVLDSFSDNKADAAFLESIAYVSINEKSGLTPVLKLLHNDRSAERGLILISSKSRIKNIHDISGKIVAYNHRLSASGYLFASYMFKKDNIVPAYEIFTGSDLNSIEKLLDGKIDSACVSENTWNDLLKKNSSINSKIKVLEYTDYIPNEVFCFRKSFSTQMNSEIVTALTEYYKKASGQKLLKELFSIDGFTIAADEDYDGVRRVIKTLDWDIYDYLISDDIE